MEPPYSHISQSQKNIGKVNFMLNIKRVNFYQYGVNPHYALTSNCVSPIGAIITLQITDCESIPIPNNYVTNPNQTWYITQTQYVLTVTKWINYMWTLRMVQILFNQSLIGLRTSSCNCVVIHRRNIIIFCNWSRFMA